MTTIRHSILITALLLGASVRAAPGGGGPGCYGTNTCGWEALEGRPYRLGLSAERVEAMLSRCRRCGLYAAEAESLLIPVRAARDESLPAEAVFTKIEEGLVKQVPVKQVAAAAERRLDCLRRAARLVKALRGPGPGHMNGHRGDRRLVLQTAMALESGLPETVLREVLDSPGKLRYGRLSHVMEVGETLQLAGLAPENTKQIMLDCLNRELNRMEMERAVRYIIAQRAKGRDFKAIRADLWVGKK